jgi:hypothetical protein
VSRLEEASSSYELRRVRLKRESEGMTDSLNHRPEIAGPVCYYREGRFALADEETKLELRTNGLAMPPGMMG